MGSSTVMMWLARSRLMMSMIDARVVDLPDPVGPVTSTRPRGMNAKLLTCAGTPNFSSGRMSNGIMRMTEPMDSRCMNTLTRNRPRPGRA